MEHKQIKISPRVIKHLGKDLITTSEVAIIELIKNSIDAKASNVKLLLFENGHMLEKKCREFFSSCMYGGNN